MRTSSSCIAFVLAAGSLVSTATAKAQTVVVPPASAPPPAPVVVAPTAAPPPAAAPVVVNDMAPAPLPERTERLHTRPNRPLLMSGLIVFGAPYVASIGIAATSSHAGDGNLWLPAIGPWLDVGSRGGCPAEGGCGAETGAKFLLVVDGILQTMGLIQVVGAFVFPETYVSTVVATSQSPTVRFTPTRIGTNGYGLSAFGHF